jgi:hypothetical protein
MTCPVERRRAWQPNEFDDELKESFMDMKDSNATLQRGAA